MLAHSLSAKNPPNRPRLLGRVKLTSAVPPELFYLCRPASTARRKHLPGMKTGSRLHLKKYLITILDFMAVLHGYCRSLEANILYIIFLPVRTCRNIEFLLNSILLFYLLTLPRELLSIISIKFCILKIFQCLGLTPCGPKPWQSLNHSRSSISEHTAREDSGSITLVREDFYCKLAPPRPNLCASTLKCHSNHSPQLFELKKQNKKQQQPNNTCYLNLQYSLAK